MKELTDIVAAFDALCAEGKPSALATVVYVDGSAYRRPGARMLIAEDGRTWGGVSGGCLERDVAARARGVIAGGVCHRVRYDSGSEEAVERGVATGCGGTIDVFIQPVTTAEPGPIAVMAAVLADHTPRTLATIVRSAGRWAGLDGIAYDADAEFEQMIQQSGPYAVSFCLPRDHTGHAYRDTNTLPDWIVLAVKDGFSGQTTLNPVSVGELPPGVQFDAANPFATNFVTVAEAEIFYDTVRPPQRLVLIGGGPDAVPVVAIARTLGWRVAVVAARPATSLHERFAAADERYVTPADAPLDGVPIGTGDAVVVMTHNLARDGAALAALGVSPRYLGVLGPRHRSDRLLAALPPLHPARGLRSPVGLDLGATSPEEIALSIVAGVQAALRGATAAPLADRPASVAGEVA